MLAARHTPSLTLSQKTDISHGPSKPHATVNCRNLDLSQNGYGLAGKVVCSELRKRVVYGALKYVQVPIPLGLYILDNAYENR